MSDRTCGLRRHLLSTTSHNHGASALTYGIILGLVGIVAVVAVTNVGENIRGLFQQAASSVDGFGGATGGGGTGGGGVDDTSPRPPAAGNPVFLDGETIVVVVDEDSLDNDLGPHLTALDADSGQTLTWTVGTQAINGIVAGSGATALSNGGAVAPTGLTYTPSAGFDGIDTFAIVLSDGDGDTADATATITVIVNNVSDPPDFAFAGITNLDEEQSDRTISGFVTGMTDGDGGTDLDRFEVVELSDPDNALASFSIALNGTATYTTGEVTGTATVEIQVSLFDSIGDVRRRPTTVTVADSGALFAFSSHEFTTCGATGRNGPSRSDCTSRYDTSPANWDDDAAFFDVNSGIQEWTVPASGSYTITARGAEGGGVSGSGGDGAIVTGTLSLSKDQVLEILVGQVGLVGTSSCQPAGGGGGTFVVDQATGDALVVAGGGGGSDTGGNEVGLPASTTSAGNDGIDQNGGDSVCTAYTPSGITQVQGGADGNGGSCGGWGTGGGGGFSGDGYLYDVVIDASSASLGSGNKTIFSGGRSFQNGGTGGDDPQAIHTGDGNADGGFGGGGAGRTSCSYGAGGGGGYSGGGAGDHEGGGGGGSFLAADATGRSLSVGNTGDGSVVITRTP